MTACWAVRRSPNAARTQPLARSGGMLVEMAVRQKGKETRRWMHHGQDVRVAASCPTCLAGDAQLEEPQYWAAFHTEREAECAHKKTPLN